MVETRTQEGEKGVRATRLASCGMEMTVLEMEFQILKNRLILLIVGFGQIPSVAKQVNWVNSRISNEIQVSKQAIRKFLGI